MRRKPAKKLTVWPVVCQFARIVAAKQRNTALGLQREFAQPLLINTPRFAIAAH